MRFTMIRTIQWEKGESDLYNVQLHKVRKYLDRASTEILIHALVFSHLDYCNALLTGLPSVHIQKLQRVQNSSLVQSIKAWTHTASPEESPLASSYFSHQIQDLRVIFQYCKGSTYIRYMLMIKQSNYALRSAHVITLEMPRMKYKSLGEKAFCAAAPKEWNALPKSLRAIEDMTFFKKNLKTHYFALAYTK